MSRGTPKKSRTEHLMTINRDMVTRNYLMKWDLDKCVGCQIGPLVCPKEALTHIPAVLENGRILQKASVDVDENKCVNCGICVEACPKHAIELTINGKPANPVIEYGAFPEFEAKTIFRKEKFDFSLKDFVIDNCPTHVISYDEQRDTMRVDFDHCIHCRQCEVASKGAFEVRQPWVGSWSYSARNVLRIVLPVLISVRLALCTSMMMVNSSSLIIIASSAAPVCRSARSSRNTKRRSLALSPTA